jgi:hypothetical protein
VLDKWALCAYSEDAMKMKITYGAVPVSEIDIALPGFEAAIEEGKAAVAADKQLALSEILASPKASIEARAGLIETHSPLFRGHGPQGELF